MEKPCPTTLLHIGAWLEKSDPFYYMTSPNMYAMSIQNDLSSITSRSEAFPNDSHTAHQSVSVANSWAGRQRSHSSTISLGPAEDFSNSHASTVSLVPGKNLNYPRTSHHSGCVTGSHLRKQQKCHFGSTPKSKLMLERWLFEGVGDSPWTMVTSIQEIETNSRSFSDPAASTSAASDFCTPAGGSWTA
jgi:hypothetical protein